MLLRIWLTKLLLPLIKLVSKIAKPEPLCTFTDVEAIRGAISPGDFIVSKENWHLSNVLVKGFWTHIAIYVGGGWVLEATPPKVRMVKLEQHIYSKDHVAFGSPMFPVDRSKIPGLVADYDGDIYDYSFIGGNEMWYCAELVYDIYKRIAPDMPFKMKKSWGVETVIPEDFYLAKDKFKVLYEVKRT